MTFEYDILGNTTRESVNKNGEVNSTSYAYDNMNRVHQYSQGEGDASGTSVLSIDYVYNNVGQIAQTRYFKNDNQTGGDGTSAGYQVTEYLYDEHGRNLGILAGTADTLNDAAQNMKLVRRYGYTLFGEVSGTVDYPNFKTDRVYIDMDSIPGDTSYMQTIYRYDSIGRLTNKIYTDFENWETPGVQKEAYTLKYDKVGNITEEKLINNYGTSVTTTKQYQYDEVGRLLEMKEFEGESPTAKERSTYGYDNVGNRIESSVPGKDKDGNAVQNNYTYTYNSLDQLEQITDRDTGRRVSQYTYDARGNQTKEETEYQHITTNTGIDRYDDKVTEHSYDLMNQLTTSVIKTPEVGDDGNRIADKVETTTNTYNAAGKRVKRVEPINDVPETTRFYYMGDSVLYTTGIGDVMQTENVLDLAGTTIMSYRFLWDYQNQFETYGNQWFTYRYDVRGSVTNIVNPAGEQVTGYKYNEFGVTVSTEGDDGFKNEHTFTNSIKDTSTGLQYMNARFYEPDTGRFLSQDSYTGNAYDPWTQHLYAYCANNPVNFIDPTGHSPVFSGKTETICGIRVTPQEYQTLQRHANQLGIDTEDACTVWNIIGGVNSGVDQTTMTALEDENNRRNFKKKTPKDLMSKNDDAYWYGPGYASSEPEMFQLFLDDLYAQEYTRLFGTPNPDAMYDPSWQEQVFVGGMFLLLIGGMAYGAWTGVASLSLSTPDTGSTQLLRPATEHGTPSFDYRQFPSDQPPAPGFRKDSPSSNWFNPITGESARYHYDHPDPIGPHIDWKTKGNPWYRYFPDGSMKMK